MLDIGSICQQQSRDFDFGRSSTIRRAEILRHMLRLRPPSFVLAHAIGCLLFQRQLHRDYLPTGEDDVIGRHDATLYNGRSRTRLPHHLSISSRAMILTHAELIDASGSMMVAMH